MRQRVEDLSVDTFGAVLSHVVHEANPQAVREAFGEVPANTNT